MKRIIVILLGALLVYGAACDQSGIGTETEADPYRDYLAYSYVDTILVGDTIQNDVRARIVHVYPAGCNYLERIESQERGDTLDVAALYHFIVRNRVPCAHGSGPDTTVYSLHYATGGLRYLSYRRSDSIRIDQPVYVEE